MKISLTRRTASNRTRTVPTKIQPLGSRPRDPPAYESGSSHTGYFYVAHRPPPLTAIDQREILDYLVTPCVAIRGAS
jgi:hypothetical protein